MVDPIDFTAARRQRQDETRLDQLAILIAGMTPAVFTTRFRQAIPDLETAPLWRIFGGSPYDLAVDVGFLQPPDPATEPFVLPVRPDPVVLPATPVEVEPAPVKPRNLSADERRARRSDGGRVGALVREAKARQNGRPGPVVIGWMFDDLKLYLRRRPTSVDTYNAICKTLRKADWDEPSRATVHRALRYRIRPEK